MKSFKERLKNIKATHDYRSESAKLCFVRGLSRIMRIKGISASKLAERAGTSEAYISKALRGDTNFTIDTMVKLSHAIGGQLHIHIADAETSVRWLEAYTNKRAVDNEKNTNEINSIIEPKKKDLFDIQKFFGEIGNEKGRISA